MNQLHLPDGLVVVMDDYETAALGDGSVARLLDLEERYGSQRAALEAHPELAGAARPMQRVRAKVAAARLGLELRGGGRPFPPDVIAEASRTLRAALLAPDDPDPLG
jgi:hypothetical protein